MVSHNDTMTQHWECNILQAFTTLGLGCNYDKAYIVSSCRCVKPPSIIKKLR